MTRDIETWHRSVAERDHAFRRNVERPKPKSPVATRRFVENVIKSVVDGLFQHVFDRFHDRITDLERQAAPLRLRIEMLEQQIEQRKWVGVWLPNKQYKQGNQCTFDGARWHCNSDTSSRPGDDGAAWTMCEKSKVPPPPRQAAPRGNRR